MLSISYIRMFSYCNFSNFVPLFPKNWLMFPCSLRYFANVPLFPKTPGRPSERILTEPQPKKAKLLCCFRDYKINYDFMTTINLLYLLCCNENLHFCHNFVPRKHLEKTIFSQTSNLNKPSPSVASGGPNSQLQVKIMKFLLVLVGTTQLPCFT